MTAIKAITTVYKGYKFRSRLEARWAVFFDVAGIRYEYEKEGFDLGAKGHYLPDFWLPDLNLWVEIKPDVLDAVSDGHSKCLALTRLTGNTSLVVCGSPWPEEYTIIDCKPHDDNDEWAYGFSEAAWAECGKCDGWWIREHDNGCYTVGKHTCGDSDRWPFMGEDSPKLMQAYTAARQARFEHREKG